MALSLNYEDALARVRAIALALPDATERISHGSPGFLIEKGKFFAISGTTTMATAKPR